METRQGKRGWYVVQTYSGYENRVKADLEQRIASMGMEDSIFEVLVPVEERVVMKDGKSRKVTRKLYPSYVMVDMILDEQSWYVVRHTPGVTGFIGAGTHPIPLLEEEVQRLLAVKEKNEVKTKVELNIKVGDTVAVKTGDFKDLTGPVVEVNPEKGKVKFTINILGRETVTEADYQDLEKL
ncbi:MAG: transcription termination/antitermination factor NusG [Synergistaceae bacterium]|nr:transcription termination/antitermination factor NusG [Synergistaceae bacterium]